MPLITKSLSLMGAALLLSGCASLNSVGPDLPAELRQALQGAGLPESALAVVAVPLQGGEPGRGGLQVQPERLMQPGSIMKLVTSVVALDRLGPNSRGQTELLADTPVRGEVLEGPLYLRGGADDQLDWGALWQMLRQLREQGLREIRGGLVIDRSLFTPGRLDIGVPAFDEAPEFPYNVIPDALYLNGQLLGLRLQSDAQQLQARLSPAWPGMRVDASGMRLADRACQDWASGWLLPAMTWQGGEAVVQLRGSFPRHCTVEPQLNLIERQWIATQALRQIWRELGGSLAGEDREGTTPAGAVRLALHQGRPLAELMYGMNKRSDNPLTRLVYLRLGAAAPGPGEDSRAAAERQIRAWFAEQGIDAQGLVMDNGSGLSRSERISARQMVALLLASQRGRHGPELLVSLPVAGVDGTLSRRLREGPAAGRARLKTGTLRDVTALAGFVPDAAGRTWVVAAMLNDERAGPRGSAVLDGLIDWLARQR
ncbi:D-alanyl-D-alanine carboxypeptidase/D-alanyl-D-alanine-endopeptidase [Kinneretia asaccharophila]|uniref:D-alanyl-D-alanine carboxypeptidase/D-alanyl-D-alanine endopeptidase n=1 Tax=Roseateles asaccharophilus TaxID=582607 RepID=UPI0025B4F46A|nr:D-alanyl-D-alanine carboxypeptidase/D-alanyl-D-alanine-endopeptidase [Roseateles asaccharophilus]MDN3544842.1 D-alanyl-D-alanine carboxypeptidase/D-alanyl-D-alanine-endopeptidase [Roseateles asaccharophilus]